MPAGSAPGVGELSRTGNSRGYYQSNGELLAKVHPKGCVTHVSEPKRYLLSTARTSFKDPNAKAQLIPYHPNALRNRLVVEFQNEAIPGRRFCAPRNQTSYECAASTVLSINSHART